jgi:hypothetical protein
MSPRDQLVWLSARLASLECAQRTNPGGIDYQEFSCFFGDPVGRRRLNPFVAILEADPDPFSLDILEPYLDDHRFISGFTAVRSWRPQRRLHRVSDVVAALVVQLAGWDVVEGTTPEARRATFSAWRARMAGTSHEERLLDAIRQASTWPDIARATAALTGDAGRGSRIQIGDESLGGTHPRGALAVWPSATTAAAASVALAERMTHRPPGAGDAVGSDFRPQIAAFALKHSEVPLSLIQRWSESEDPSVRTWGLTVLLERGALEGDLAVSARQTIDAAYASRSGPEDPRQISEPLVVWVDDT